MTKQAIDEFTAAWLDGDSLAETPELDALLHDRQEAEKLNNDEFAEAFNDDTK